MHYNLYVKILDDSDNDISCEPFTKSEKSITGLVVKSTPSTSSLMTQKNNKLLLSDNIEKLHEDSSSK